MNYQHKFAAPVKRFVDGKEYVFRKCWECGSVMREGDDYFNLHCPEAAEKMRKVIQEVSSNNSL